MKNFTGPVVGLSFGEDAIHAVVVQVNRSGDCEVLTTASIAVPDGILSDRAVTRPEVATSVLKQLLASNKITAKLAVVGLPSRSVFARLIRIPPVLGEERRAVIRGEIEHLNILNAGQGAFDYVPFDQGEGVDGTKGQPVFFFAAEHSVVDGYKQVVEAAGLKVIGMEPADYAAVRSLAPKLEKQDLALAISFGAQHTELFFYRFGKPIYARRLDTGISQLTVAEVIEEAIAEEKAAEPDPFQDMGFVPFVEWPPKPQPAAEPAAEVDEKLTRADRTRQLLLQEIARSMDYFRREYRQELDGMAIYVLPNHLDLAGMPALMSALLEHDVEFGYAFDDLRVPSSLSNALRQEGGVPLAPALGLALGPLGGKFGGIQVFDLLTEDASIVQARKAPRLLTGAFVISAALMAVAGATAFFLARQDAPVQDELATANATLNTVTGQKQLLQTARNQQVTLVREIRSHNIPWTNVLRFLSQAVPAEVGLTSVAATGSVLTIKAETNNPNAATSFWSRMQNSPFFASATLSDLTRVDGKSQVSMTATLPAVKAGDTSIGGGQ